MVCGFITPKSFVRSVSAPKKLFRTALRLAVPGKLFLEMPDRGLVPVKLLPPEGVPWGAGFIPGKLLLWPSTEVRREEMGVEMEEMEDREGPREEGRDGGAEAGGVDLGVLLFMDSESTILLLRFVSRLFVGFVGGWETYNMVAGVSRDGAGVDVDVCLPGNVPVMCVSVCKSGMTKVLKLGTNESLR